MSRAETKVARDTRATTECVQIGTSRTATVTRAFLWLLLGQRGPLTRSCWQLAGNTDAVRALRPVLQRVSGKLPRLEGGSLRSPERIPHARG